MIQNTRRKSGSSSIPDALRDAGLPNVHLKIGEGIVTSSNVLISTVLGSCVSVSFFHAQTGLAGIFHAMLPSHTSVRGENHSPCKFVDSAIDLVYEQFCRRGATLKDVELKLFGGAFSMGIGASCQVQSLVNVGARNIQVARDTLARLGLSLSKEHVGGDRGRKLVFDTKTGEVWLKLLGKAEGQAVIKEQCALMPSQERNLFCLQEP